MKYKLLLLLALTVIFASKCEEDEEEIVVFDYAGQAQKDNNALQTYLLTHFLDANGELDTITNGETPIKSMQNLDSITIPVTKDYYDDGVEGSITVDYKLYYLVTQEGANNVQFPSKVDSVHVSYKGMLLDHTEFDRSDYGTWLEMRGVISGWTYGLEKFNPGNFTVNTDGSFSFTGVGKGILFIPSGLAYGNAARTKIPANSPLIFYVNLNMLHRTDYDRDGILSMYEDVNINGNFNDDDTDGDGYPNFYDSDDDGDGTLTKNENPDPNGDGNPNDAQDLNGNEIPDYLDSTTK